jgi:hypothetical protein
MTLFILALATPASAEEGNLTAWMVEWDFAMGLEERDQLAESLSAVEVFAAAFNEQDQPFLKPGLQAALTEVGSGQDLFLTIVNDRLAGGKTVAKDPDLISRLVASPESRAKHQKDLLTILASGPFVGLDIDYERIKTGDMGNFLTFCQELQTTLAKAGKRLRVVLEPKRQLWENPLPPGPEYVLMAYNLFGGHSGPGPKANPDFIAELALSCQKGRNLPRLALATGGFVWRGSGPTRGVTEEDAWELVKEYSATPRRDATSAYLTFTYESPQEGDCEVWFADGETLAFLIHAARDNGFKNFDLWRLGGNNPTSLETVKQAMREKRVSSVTRETRETRVNRENPAGREIRVSRGGTDNPERLTASSIGKALAFAQPGDRIVVAPGEYRENLYLVTPGLTISAAAGRDKSPSVILRGDGVNPLLTEEGTDTLWRGICFDGTGRDAGDLVVLLDFSGRFEQCRFLLPAAQGNQKLAATTTSGRLFRPRQSVLSSAAVSCANGSPSFHACEFLGGRGTAVFFQSGTPGDAIALTYCLIEGFPESALRLDGVANARLANCLLAFNQRFLIDRQSRYQGQTEIVNSVIFFNSIIAITSGQAKAPDLVLANSFYSPEIWRQGTPLASQRGLKIERVRIASPGFRQIGRPVFLNLGIDDTVNAPVWEEVIKLAKPYGYHITLGVNTTAANEETWQLVHQYAAEGHEICSHTCSHAMLQINPPLTLGYYQEGVTTANLQIDNRRNLLLTVNGKDELSLALGADAMTFTVLGRTLARYGVDARVSPYYGGVPALFLRETGNLDITLPRPTVPLFIDSDAYFRYEMETSLQVLTSQFPDQPEFILINPFTVTSEMTRSAMMRYGYVAGRAHLPEGEIPVNTGQGRKWPSENKIDVYTIPSFSLNAIKEILPNNPPLDNLRLALDFLKINLITASIYAHNYDEYSLDEWAKLLPIVQGDSALKVVSLLDIVQEVKNNGVATGNGYYSYPLPDPVFDYRPRPDSPLLEAGQPLGLASDFAGRPLPADTPPSIGLYKYPD